MSTKTLKTKTTTTLLPDRPKAKPKKVKPVTYHARLLLCLKDGRFHTFAELFEAVAKYIDPKVADKEYRKRHPDWKNDKEKDRVVGGKKRLVFLSLNSAHHHAKTVEVGEGVAMERQYRLTALGKERMAK